MIKMKVMRLIVEMRSAIYTRVCTLHMLGLKTFDIRAVVVQLFIIASYLSKKKLLIIANCSDRQIMLTNIGREMYISFNLFI